MTNEQLNQIEILIEEKLEALYRAHDIACDNAPDETPVWENGEIVGYERPPEWDELDQLQAAIDEQENYLATIQAQYT